MPPPHNGSHKHNGSRKLNEAAKQDECILIRDDCDLVIEHLSQQKMLAANSTTKDFFTDYLENIMHILSSYNIFFFLNLEKVQ